MINFDSLTLKALLIEITPVLTAGRVQKVQQPSRDELLFSIRSGGKNYKLFVCANPKYPHVSFLTEEGAEYRDIEIPQKPPMFCMLLRKHMEGAKIKAVVQPEYERILEIYFDSYNELGARVPLVLACEFMGKYSNIILYGYEDNIILGSSHFVSSEKSREREIAGGLPYIYPPKLRKRDLLQTSQTEFLSLAMAIPLPLNYWLNESFHYISLAIATELCRVAGIDVRSGKIIATSKDKILALYGLLRDTLSFDNLNPSVSKDKKLYSLAGIDPDIEWERMESVNRMVDVYFGYQMYTDKFSRLKSELSKVVRNELKKEKTRLDRHKKIMESEEKADKYRRFADIIMANLHNIKQGELMAELEDFYEENKKIQIPLDPLKSPNANAQKYYKLYNKAKQAAKFSRDLLAQIQEEFDYLQSVKNSLDQAETLVELKQIKAELQNQNIIKTKRHEKEAKEKIELIEYTSSDNYKIYVGKNNRQNDFLISKIASPDDIWLHTHNIPGSHVLIKLPHENKDIPPESTMHEAANLAAYYSQARNSSNVPVIYTRRKFLKKPPGTRPGYVTYSNEKLVAINPDVTMIKKLT